MTSKAVRPADQASDDELNDLLDEALHDFQPLPEIQVSSLPSSPDEPDETPDRPGIVPPNSFVDASAFAAASQGRQLPASALQRGLRVNEPVSPPPNSWVEGGGFFPPNVGAGGGSDGDLAALFDRMKLLCQTAGDPAPGPGPDSGPAVLPMMEAVMQSLLSKDLLYPAIRDLNEKFPAWLASHRDSLPPGEWQRFHDQYEVTRQLRDIFEADESTHEDPPRFQIVMELMEKIQSLGHPPTDLVGAASEAGPHFDEATLESALGHPDQCKMS
ncbi:peroxisomal biogenesis factor 19-like [Tigriopus californicus]|nr:peroxisomal biogenesis factor 19-like [Tigriopus californicus]